MLTTSVASVSGVRTIALSEQQYNKVSRGVYSVSHWITCFLNTITHTFSVTRGITLLTGVCPRASAEHRSSYRLRRSALSSCQSVIRGGKFPFQSHISPIPRLRWSTGGFSLWHVKPKRKRETSTRVRNEASTRARTQHRVPKDPAARARGGKLSLLLLYSL